MKLAAAAGVFAAAAVIAFLAWSAAKPERISETELAAALPSGFAGDPEVGELFVSHWKGCAGCHASEDGDGGDSLALGSGDPLETRFGVFPRAEYFARSQNTASAAGAKPDFVNAHGFGRQSGGEGTTTRHSRTNTIPMLRLPTFST